MSRDPARIKPMLAKLEQMWEANPDWRLGQLVDNVSHMAGSNTFYIEDDRFMAQLEAMNDPAQ